MATRKVCLQDRGDAQEIWYKSPTTILPYFFYRHLSERTGKIVRINPHEVHIDDPDFYHKFYQSSRKLKKYPWYYKVSGVDEVSFGTEDHEVHRQRIGVYKDLFSIRSIVLFDPVIKTNIQKLCDKLDQHVELRTPINLSHAYRVLTSDTITTYIGLGPAPLLDDEDLGKSYRRYARIVTESSVLVRHFPPLAYFRFLPHRLVANLSSDFGILKDHLDVSPLGFVYGPV